MNSLTDERGRLRPGWSFAFSAIMVCAAFYICGYTAAAIAGDRVLGFDAIFRPLLALALLLLFSWILTVADHVTEHRVAAQGLPLSQGWWKQFGGGCVVGSLLVLAASGQIALFGGLSFHFTLGRRNLVRAVLIVFILLTGALAEELAFRGYPFQRLVQAVGPWAAMALFSALFASIHLGNPGASAWGLTNTVLIGIVLSVAYLRTRALWLPWGIHFAWNATMGLVLGLPVSGMHYFSVLVKGVATGPKWLTGGGYGIEASAPGTLAVLVGLFAVAVIPLKSAVGVKVAPPARDLAAGDAADSGTAGNADGESGL